MEPKKSKSHKTSGMKKRKRSDEEKGADYLLPSADPRFSHPLKDVPEPQKKLADAFLGLGYGSIEDALGVMQIAGRELEKYLGVDPQQLDNFASAVSPFAAPVTTEERVEIEAMNCPLGVALNRIPAPEKAPDLPSPNSVSATASSVNLIPQMPPIRNQGVRGTCVAFASLAAYEHALTQNHTNVDLSEQFLYWDCKANDGFAGEGTWVRIAYDRLYQDGCCLEDKWVYNPTKILGNEGQGPPPPGAQVQALTYRLSKFLNLASTSVSDIKAVLQAGRCVSFSIPIYNSFYLNTHAKKTGEIPNPVPGEMSIGGHAMCFVGYVDDTSVPGYGGGLFLLRNSWGTTFGMASPYGAGYGTITYAYIARLCREAFSPQ